MAETSWNQTNEITLDYTFNDWRIETNRIRWNLAEINPAANTVSANTANFHDVNITGNTFITTSGLVGITSANTDILSDYTKIGVDQDDTLVVNSTTQFESSVTIGDTIGNDNLTINATTTVYGDLTVEAPYSLGGDGSNITNLDYEQLASIGGTKFLYDHDQFYSRKPIPFNELNTEVQKSLLPGGVKILVRNNSVPVGWSLDTGYTNDTAIRLVTGTISSSGSKSFSEVFKDHTHTPTGGVELNTLSLGKTQVAGTISVSTGSGSLKADSKSITENTTSVALSPAQIPNHWHYVVANQRVSNDDISATTSLARETSAGGDTEYDLGAATASPTLAFSSGVNGVARNSSNPAGEAHNHTLTFSHGHTISGNPSVTLTNKSDGHTHTLNGSTLTFTGAEVSTDLRVRYYDFRIIQRATISSGAGTTGPSNLAS